MMANGHDGLPPSNPPKLLSIAPRPRQVVTNLKRATSLLLLLATASLTACLPWKRERVAYADLCESEFQFKVPGPQGETTLYLETYLYDHAAQ